MKTILIFIVSLLIFCSNLLAEEAIPLNTAPSPPSAGTNEEKTAGEVPDLSQKLPSEISPDNIRKFFAKPGGVASQTKEENYIILNFDNAGLKDVISTISSITKENFILGPGVDARITIHSSKKIPVSEVMGVFESVLEVNNMALVRSGEFFKIVPGNVTKQKPTDVQKGNEIYAVNDTDRPVTQIIPVEFVPVTEVTTVLTPLLSQFGSIIPNPRNSLIIVNDMSSNIVRLLKILKEIDVDAFANTRMSFFKPSYSDVTSLANELQEVLNALDLMREGISLVPVDRINSLIIFSSSSTLLKTVEGWLRKLDEEVMTGQNIFVYPVQNVKAESIAEILKAIYGESDGQKPAVQAQQQTAAAKTRTQQIRRQPQSSSPQQSTTGSRVEIITFEPRNSLIILAPPGIYREMVETIKIMDAYPREVLIEAIIAEVTLSDTDKYGIQWSVLHSVYQNDNRPDTDVSGLLQGLSSNAPSYTLPLSLNPPSATASGLSYLLYRPDKFVALIHALATKGKVKILSSPRLLVRDQEEANIEVGEEIPTATSTTSSTTTETLTQNIEYKTVGIKLKIKPTINDEKTVVLDLEQEVSAKGANQQVGQTGNLFPSFTTTKTKTSIIVPDRQGIVIGGIMEEKKDKSYQGVPLLSAIPVFGNLFRYTSDITTKKELVIIITPHVITSKNEGDALTSEFMGKLKEIKQFLGKEDNKTE